MREKHQCLAYQLPQHLEAVTETALIINCCFPETMHTGSLRARMAHQVTGGVDHRDNNIPEDKKTGIK